MIVEEVITINNQNYRHTFSDSKKQIIQQNSDIVYDEALDELDSNHSYIESDIEIEDEENI